MTWNFKKYLYLSIFIFIGILCASYYLAPVIGSFHNPISHTQLVINSQTIEYGSNLEYLLICNILVSFVIIISGAIGTELIALIILSWNAFDLGEIINAVPKYDTINVLYILLPHGIIELPMMIIASSFGCVLSLKAKEMSGNRGIIGWLIYKGQVKDLIIEHAIIPYIRYILPMVLLATIIESTISIYIMKLIFNGS
jgi:stage II sporulation protein M